MYFTYVVKNSISGKIYIGHTENLEKRIDQHNNSDFDKKAFTKINRGNGKWTLVHYETFETRKEARRREDQLKSSRGRAFIYKKIIGSVAQR